MFNENRKLKIVCTAIFITLATLYGLAYIFTSMYLKSTNLREMIINQAEQRTSRKVSLDGDMEFSIDWNMSPKVVINHLVVANIPSEKNPVMLSVDQLRLKFSLLKLIFREFNIISLDFENPVIFLESKDGINNWDFINKDPDPKRAIKVSINDVIVNGGSITLQQDAQPEQKLKIEKLVLHGNVEDMDFTVHLNGNYNELPIQTIFKTTFGESETRFFLSSFVSGASDLSGQIEIEHKPIKISGSLRSNKFDLTDLLHKASTNQNPSGEYSLPNNPIPVADLKGGDVDFNVDIEELILDKITIKNFNLNISDKKDIIILKLDPAAKLANGSVNLDIEYDINPVTPTLVFNLTTNNLKLEDVLEAAGNRSPLKGSNLSFKINLSSAGDNLNALVANSKGQILGQLGPGQFLNTTGFSNPFSNILSSVISFNKNESSTAFNCGVMNLRVNNGVGSGTNNVGVEAASVNVLGNGMIDLRNGRVKFTITPTNILSKFDISQFNMAQMIQVTGTVANPQVSLNPISVGGAVASMAKIAGLATGLPGIAVMAGSELSGSQSNTITPCKTALSN